MWENKNYRGIPGSFCLLFDRIYLARTLDAAYGFAGYDKFFVEQLKPVERTRFRGTQTMFLT